MEKKPVIFMVWTQCLPEYAEEFNKWYDEVHVPLLLKFKGLKRVARYRVIGESSKYHEYLASYEFRSEKIFKEFWDSPERAVALEERLNSWEDKPYEIKAMVYYGLIRSWGKIA